MAHIEKDRATTINTAIWGNMKTKLFQKRGFNQLNHSTTTLVHLSNHRSELLRRGGQYIAWRGRRRCFAIWREWRLRVLVDEFLEVRRSDFPITKLVTKIGNHEDWNVDGNVGDVLLEVFDGIKLDIKCNDWFNITRVKDKKTSVATLVDIYILRIHTLYTEILPKKSTEDIASTCYIPLLGHFYSQIREVLLTW